MHSMLARILEGNEKYYPHNLEKKYARVFDNIMSRWGSVAADEYFSELFFDNRGNRQGFPREVMDEIFFLSRLHDQYSAAKRKREEVDVWDNEIFKRRMEEECNIEFSPGGFFWAAEHGHEKALKLFLEAGVDVNLRNHFGWTPLMVSTFMGSEEAATLLINTGANVSVFDRRGYTPLHWAAQRGYAKVVALLLQKGAYVNVKSKKGLTPLLQAAALGRADVVAILLSRGANANMGDNERWTPLHKAVANGHLEVIRLLKEAHADPYAEHVSGATPLMIAKRLKNNQIIDAVLG